MAGQITRILAGAALALMAGPALADAIVDLADSGGPELPYLQCVPYARQVSGIQIYGDAWTWWDQAEGRYKRGFRPRVGAVMAFAPHGNMRLGHVAAVSRIVNSRTVLLRHANWSPIDGRRGQIEDNVRAVDVSEDNDWSEVRVWYDPIQSLGGTAWPVEGFIYNEKVKAKDAAKFAKTERAASSERVLPAARNTPERSIGARSMSGRSVGGAKFTSSPRHDIVGEIIAANER